MKNLNQLTQYPKITRKDESKDDLMEFYINYKILGAFMNEYNLLIEFFEKSVALDIMNFLIKRRNKLHREIKALHQNYALKKEPKRDITRIEYDKLVELAKALDFKTIKHKKYLLRIQKSLNENRINFIFFELWHTIHGK